MTTDHAPCDRCGNRADHLFPGADATSRICSNCYQALELHQQGKRLIGAGYGAIAIGVALLLAVLLVVLLAS